MAPWDNKKTFCLFKNCFYLCSASSIASTETINQQGWVVQRRVCRPCYSRDLPSLSYFITMSNTKVLLYENSPITFGIGDNIWVNANEMARAIAKFYDVPAKPPKDFLKSDMILSYVNILEDRFNKRENQKENRPIEKCSNVLRVVNGGDMPGTWMHEKLALRFAQWLSAEFSLWVDDQIKELLTKGTVSIGLPKDYPSALRALADSHEARMIAEAAAEQNKEKAEGYELLIEKADNYTLKEAADLLGSGQNRFSKWLMQNKFLQAGGIPYQTYLRNQPYFVLKEVTKAGIVYHTPMITPKGMDYFTKLRNRGQMNEILNKVSKTLDTSMIK